MKVSLLNRYSIRYFPSLGLENPLKMFVSNRVAAIQDLTDWYQWQYVTNNLADVLSGELDIKKLSNRNFLFCVQNFLRGKIQYAEKHPAIWKTIQTTNQNSKLFRTLTSQLKLKIVSIIVYLL